MTKAEAIELVRDGVSATPAATWADFGAGSGTFTEALAELLGADATVLAIDRDPAALRDLRRLAANSSGVNIKAVAGDVLDFDSIPELHAQQLDGALFANVLHFVREPDRVLRSVRELLEPDGVVIVVEYDRRKASRWVPYPLSLNDLSSAAQKAGFGAPRAIGRRKSQYQGELYSAVFATIREKPL